MPLVRVAGRLFFPHFPRLDLPDQEAAALVVGGVEPEHPVKDAPGFLEAIEPPQAEPESLHAPQERAVIDVAPRQYTLEFFPERQLPDPQPNLVGPDRFLGATIKAEVAEMGVGVEAAQVGLAKFHEDLVCALVVAAFLEIVGPQDWILVRLVRIFAGQDLFHFEGRARSVSDYRLRPLRNRL